MQLSDITNKVNKLANSWEEFKNINERRLDEIKKHGFADPLLLDQINKISHSIDEQKSRLDNIEVAIERPQFAINHKSEEDYEYKQAFSDYLRKGVDTNLNNLEIRSYNAASDPDGGYLIRSNVANEINHDISNQVVMRELASVQMISTDSLDIIDDTQSLTAGWVQETQARDDTISSKFNKKKIQVHEMYAQPKATQKLIDDASIDIEKWLSEKLTESFAKLESYSFILGDGVGKPKGILSYEDGTEWGKIEQLKAKNLNSDDLIKLYFTLNEKYAANATFLMNRFTLAQVRMLKCPNTNQYIWTPGLYGGCPDRLLGAPVRIDSNMPAINNGNIAIALADFKASYKIVDRIGMRVLRDPFTHKPFVKFYSTKRVGGDVINSNAIKLLKIA